MFQKKEKQELQHLSLNELDAHRKEALIRKVELLQKKKESSLSAEEQNELDELALYCLTLDRQRALTEAVENLSNSSKSEQKFAVLKISRGRRFNPNTGKREAPVFSQTFTASEYRLFMANHKSLGYTIEEVVSNPFAEE